MTNHCTCLSKAKSKKVEDKMKTYHLGEKVKIGGVEGRLTGINAEDSNDPDIKIDLVDFPISEFSGVEIELTKYDLSVRVMNGAEHSVY